MKSWEVSYMLLSSYNLWNFVAFHFEPFKNTSPDNQKNVKKMIKRLCYFVKVSKSSCEMLRSKFEAFLILSVIKLWTSILNFSKIPYQTTKKCKEKDDKKILLFCQNFPITIIIKKCWEVARFPGKLFLSYRL